MTRAAAAVPVRPIDLAPGVRVISFDSDAGRPRSVVLEPDQTTLTQPGETLQLECAGPTSARVLFITAPPYPADHSDTVMLDRHRELTAAELAGSERR